MTTCMEIIISDDITSSSIINFRLELVWPLLDDFFLFS